MTYEADDLTRERIEEIRHLATVKKVKGMLIQEWEVVALCDRALRSTVAPTVPEGMMLVHKSAVELAWKIAKDARDRHLENERYLQDAERELEELSKAGFDAHLPTLDDLRGILRDPSSAIEDTTK